MAAISPEKFILKVTLDRSGTSAIEAIVVPQRAFDASKIGNGERITIKGDLAAKQRDRYHLRLTLAEWRNEENNESQICEFDLTPGKVEGFGFISSVVHLRTVVLTPLSTGSVRDFCEFDQLGSRCSIARWFRGVELAHTPLTKDAIAHRLTTFRHLYRAKGDEDCT